jgi:hypothetical protein
VIRTLKTLAWILLFLGGAVTWGVSLGALNPAVPPDLAALPEDLGGFRTLEVFPVDSEVLGELPPDRFTFRAVGDEAGHVGELYAAYFTRGRRWSGRPHDLEYCYRAQGYESESLRHLTTADGSRFAAQDFVDGEKKIRVFHWVQYPGIRPGQESPKNYLMRILDDTRLRQDMASIYVEFPLKSVPTDEAACQAVQALMSALDRLWSRPSASLVTGG